MKTIKHITLKTNEGKPMFDDVSKKELNPKYLITVCLGGSRFANNSEQWSAYDISKKIEKIEDGKDIELEDAEYTLVKKLVEAFEPYRNGFTFIPFLELFK